MITLTLIFLVMIGLAPLFVYLHHKYIGHPERVRRFILKSLRHRPKSPSELAASMENMDIKELEAYLKPFEDAGLVRREKHLGLSPQHPEATETLHLAERGEEEANQTDPK
jgi:DNA-binding transcriptional ArsR family regulator